MASDIEKKLGQRVAHLRKQAGLTQAGLAEKTKVATETISRLERGAAIPSLARMETIAKALKVTLSDLFRFTNPDDAKEHSIDRMIVALRRRPAKDIDLVSKLADIVLAGLTRS